MNEDRSVRYHRLRRRAAIASTVAGTAWMVALATSGAAEALAARADAAGAVFPSSFARPVSIVIVIAVIAIGWELISLPFGFYRTFVLERKYGLSSEPLATWLGDH